MRSRLIAVLCGAAFLASACQTAPPPPDEGASRSGEDAGSARGGTSGEPSAGDADAATTPAPSVDPAEVSANELGQIPVIMHHRVLEGGGGEYDRSPEELREELEGLYEAGYRPIRAVDLVRGELDVPAGTTPVVLTFDDSSREQFALDDDGQVDPDSAVGILLDVAERHPEFTPVASLYINAGPFGVADSEPLLTWLHEHGFELGNHTLRHANLGRLSADEVRRELALGARVITDTIPDADVATLSLPLGVWPEPRELAYRGSHAGSDYAHEGVLLVGANPAPSPFRADFDPLAIPRIRSSAWEGGEPNFGSDYWLDWFENNPQRRYISDGDPERVSFPAELDDELDDEHRDRAMPY